MDSVSETPVREPSRASGSWITAGVAVGGLIVIAVVVAATVTSNGKGVGFGPMTRAQDRAVQSDLRNALTAEKTIYTDNMKYSANVETLRSVEPSLDWGGRLRVDVGFFRLDDSEVVCLDEASTSGATFSIGDVAAGPLAGTYYGTRACPAVATPVDVSSLGMSWDAFSSDSPVAVVPPNTSNNCETEMATFHTAIEAWRAMGPNPWPEGDAFRVANLLTRAGLLASPTLTYNSARTPPPANTWYYDAATHQFTSRCDA